MISGLYSAASALNAASMNQDLLAENLANANVPGYRRSGLTFEAVQAEMAQGGGPASPSMRGTTTAANYTNFDPGPMQYTGNPLDVALSGNVYFVLDGPNGPVYTRNGTFQNNARGQLQSASGLPVRSTGGAITIPPATAQVQVTKDGVVKADNVEIGRLQLAEFQDPSGLQRVGTTLFAGPQGSAPRPGTFSVEQGYREGSNVQVVNEMVNMLTGMRSYEAAERAMRVISDAVSLTTKPQ
jgi:flagellar basal-body rod protein FlgF